MVYAPSCTCRRHDGPAFFERVRHSSAARNFSAPSFSPPHGSRHANGQLARQARFTAAEITEYQQLFSRGASWLAQARGADYMTFYFAQEAAAPGACRPPIADSRDGPPRMPGTRHATPLHAAFRRGHDATAARGFGRGDARRQ